MSVSLLFLVFANYFASSPFLNPNHPSFLGLPHCASGTSIRACLPGHPAAPSPRSLHRPPPWFPRQRDKEHVVQIPGPEQAWCQWWRQRTLGKPRRPECPGAVTHSSHWVETTSSILWGIVVPPLAFPFIPGAGTRRGVLGTTTFLPGAPCLRKPGLVPRTPRRAGPLPQVLAWPTTSPTRSQKSACVPSERDTKNSPTRI